MSISDIRQKDMIKKIVLAVAILAIAAGIYVFETTDECKPYRTKVFQNLVPMTDAEYNQYRDMQKNTKLLEAYKAYYTNTETLLDSVDVDVDDPILETDAGSNYLRAKYTVDSINAEAVGIPLQY